VKLWAVILLLVVIDCLAALVMLRVRRRAPVGSYFRDSQQAAGAFTVTGTIFAVLVGFVFLLAFQSYENARSSSQDEAIATLALFHTVDRFPAPARSELRADLACYSRAVIGSEWPAMADQRSSPLVDRWLSVMTSRFDRINPRGAAQSDATQNWFTETDALQQGRRGRLAEAPRFVPTTIWVILLATGLAVIGFVLLFADSRELRLSQVVLATAVTTAVAASLLTVNFLDRPYGDHAGAITPTAMRGTLATIEREQPADVRQASRCDQLGRPR
jgi:hypothetical protein